MDLLRLVLIHQPDSKLKSVLKLSRGDQFNVIRSKLYDSISGEIDDNTYRTVRLEHIRHRAVFLRDSECYLRHLDFGTDRDTTFWPAIRSGVPEIQAGALLMLKESDDLICDVISRVPNPATIPWTPALVREMSAISRENDQNNNGLWLRQYINCRSILTLEVWRACGRIMEILTNSITRERNEQCEEVISALRITPELVFLLKAASGYLFEFNPVPDDDLTSEAIQLATLMGANDTVDIIVSWGYDGSYSTPRITQPWIHIERCRLIAQCENLKSQIKKDVLVNIMNYSKYVVTWVIRCFARNILDNTFHVESAPQVDNNFGTVVFANIKNYYVWPGMDCGQHILFVGKRTDDSFAYGRPMDLISEDSPFAWSPEDEEITKRYSPWLIEQCGFNSGRDQVRRASLYAEILQRLKAAN